MSSPIQPSIGKTREELDDTARRIMARRSRRSFLTGGVASLAGLAGYEWLSHSTPVGELQKPLRFAEDWNAHIVERLFRDRVLAPTYSKSRATELRLNGAIGLKLDLIPDTWRLQVVGLERPEQYPQYVGDVDLWNYRSQGEPLPQQEQPDAKAASPAQQQAPESTGLTTTPGILLTMADIEKLPAMEMVTQFKCIEGWSQIVLWQGVRFSDFLQAYPPKLNASGALPRYVAMETPDGDFFAGFDMAPLLHPQTLLCYAMGGKPLSPGHGAPLRLSMPIKYGYKQVKQIAKVTYTDRRPDDYWADLGYDWYAGL